MFPNSHPQPWMLTGLGTSRALPVCDPLPSPPAQSTSVTPCAKGSGLGLVCSCLQTLLNNSLLLLHHVCARNVGFINAFLISKLILQGKLSCILTTFALNLCQREFYTTNLKLQPSFFLTLSSQAEQPGEEFALWMQTQVNPSWWEVPTFKAHRASAQLEECCRKGLLEPSNGVWVVPGDGERSEHVS